MTSKVLKNILYVEDDADIQCVAKIALETLGGFKIMVCSSGEEALLAAEECPPDMFLLDVMMPGMDGPETLQELRKLSTLKDIPAMFMTAKVQPQEVAQLKSLGAFSVLAKPFEAMTLADQIKSAWATEFQ